MRKIKLLNQTKDKKPTAEEIQKEFEEFIKQKYGGTVRFVQQPSSNIELNEQDTQKQTKTIDLKFDLKPKEVKQYLDRYVIKQHEAKKALAIAVCDHYNHVRKCHENPKLLETDYSKQNIIVLGSTGVGKTYMIRHIAKLIGVPFVKADATRFSETGYVGANVEDLIRDLVTQADGNLELAQYGIVYIDEADKLATPPNIMGRDISGRGVQFGLLKLMEETDVDLRSSSDPAAQVKVAIEFQQKGEIEEQIINTRHILFIMSGAFNELSDIIEKRLNWKSIGFSMEDRNQQRPIDLLNQITPQDFIDFGFEPEFIGRIPIHVACEDLEAEDLYYILKNSEGSIIKQYEQSFQAYNVEAMFSDASLHQIAVLAHHHKTGARALMTVCEKVLRDYKFELPSSPIKEFSVTKEMVNDPKAELEKIMTNQEYNSRLVFQERIRRYEEDFQEKHKMKIQFDQDATEMIYERFIRNQRDPQKICDEILESYQHGLNLIKQNTGKSDFTFTKSVVENPDEVLEGWIRESYNEKSKESRE